MRFVVGIQTTTLKENVYTSLGRQKIIKVFLGIKTQKQKKSLQIGIKRAGSIENLMCLEINRFGIALALKLTELA
jgi:hypothetical protein